MLSTSMTDVYTEVQVAVSSYYEPERQQSAHLYLGIRKEPYFLCHGSLQSRVRLSANGTFPRFLRPRIAQEGICTVHTMPARI